MPSALAALAAQRGQLFPWSPVFLAIGIGIYFALPVEPPLVVHGGLAAGALGLALASRWLGEGVRPLAYALCLVALGLCLAGTRAHRVGAEVLDFRYYGSVEGRIIKIDRSVSDKVRLTLDRVVLERTPPERTPERVRVSLHGEQGFIHPEPGLRVVLTGHLGPPEGPVEPGGFDFQRMAWFDRLGAVGYTRTPVLAIAPAAEGRSGLAIHRLRMRISEAVQARVPGEPGAFAAAILTGDRSGMGRETQEALRASNLAHLLAISGLHMGLLTGFVFAACRTLLALWPRVALRLPTKKIAAIVALGAGAFYLALSGGSVATERAFIMVGVMLGAILFDRRALSLRAVALAGLIVLTLRPEELTGPGFQMSFAATTALVAVFARMRDVEAARLPRWTRPVVAVVVSSAVAGAATAPVAAAHFNRIADFGLLANLASVPLIGLVVMPAAVLAACLAPLGLAGIGLAIMTPAIRWILGVAHWVAGLDGAVSYVPSPPAVVLPLLVLGMLFVILWQGRARVAGLVPAMLALALWTGVERPPLLVSANGNLVGLMTEEGRALSKPRGDGFAARSWLENDGDGSDQDIAAARSGFAGDKGAVWFEIGETRVLHLSGRGAVDRVGEACGEVETLVLLAGTYEGDPPCRVIDRAALARTGALAVFAEADGLRFVGARDRAGRRLWNTR